MLFPIPKSNLEWLAFFYSVLEELESMEVKLYFNWVDEVTGLSFRRTREYGSLFPSTSQS